MNKPIIETGVPIPPFEYQHTRYHFDKLKIGQDLLITGDYLKARTAASTFKKRNPGFNFTSRKCPDGLRIWRIK